MVGSAVWGALCRRVVRLGGTVPGVVRGGTALCQGVVRRGWSLHQGVVPGRVVCALVPYQGARGTDISSTVSQDPSDSQTLSSVPQTPQFSHISKHVKKGCDSGILCFTLGADHSQIPVFLTPPDPGPTLIRPLDPTPDPTPGSAPWIRPLDP